MTAMLSASFCLLMLTMAVGALVVTLVALPARAAAALVPLQVAVILVELFLLAR